MKYKLTSHTLLLILCLFILSFGSLNIGHYNARSDVGPRISVSPEYPKEQINENGIFNVMFKSNHHYNLTLKIANTSNENKNITIVPNTAYTSNSGNILFDKSNYLSNKYDFRSLFNQKEKKLTIPANSISRVNFGLKMPPKPYKGIIVGGFYITIPNNNKTNVKSNFQIKNDFSYGLAAAIHNNNEKYQPKVQLGNINPNNNNNNSQMQVQSNIRNVNASIISGMNIKSEIIKNSSNKIISKSNNNNLSMAPNSSFNYVDTIDNSLSPGNYKIKFNITDDSGHSWQESKNFRINTREYITHFTKKVPWTLYTLIGVIILLALIIILLIYYQFRNKNNKQSKNSSKN